jgi:hypothetical protein
MMGNTFRHCVSCTSASWFQPKQHALQHTQHRISEYLLLLGLQEQSWTCACPPAATTCCC